MFCRLQVKKSTLSPREYLTLQLTYISLGCLHLTLILGFIRLQLKLNSRFNLQSEACNLQNAPAVSLCKELDVANDRLSSQMVSGRWELNKGFGTLDIIEHQVNCLVIRHNVKTIMINVSECVRHAFLFRTHTCICYSLFQHKAKLRKTFCVAVQDGKILTGDLGL